MSTQKMNDVELERDSPRPSEREGGEDAGQMRDFLADTPATVFRLTKTSSCPLDPESHQLLPDGKAAFCAVC